MNNEYEQYEIKTFFLIWSNYTYIVLDKITNSAFIIDPSWELDKIVNQLNQLNVGLEAIFLTHSHMDHVNLVNPLVRIFNPTVYMSKAEIDYYKYRCSNLNALNDLDKVYVGSTEIESILTPGHTAGSMCYMLTESLFTGDTVFSEGCGMCYCDGGSAGQMFDSIQKLKAKLPVGIKVYPGHSYGKAPGQEMQQLIEENIYFLINDKEKFVNFRERKNQKGLLNFK